MNYNLFWYRHSDGYITCPYPLRVLARAITYLYCGGAQARILAQAQRAGPQEETTLPDEEWPPIQTLMQAYCDVSPEWKWRRVRNYHVLPAAVMRMVVHQILSWESAAPRVFSAEVGKLLLANPHLCHPAPTVFHPRLEPVHDWFAVWAGLVKQHKILNDEDAAFYRWLAEYEVTMLVMDGGQAAAKRVAADIFEAIRFVPARGTESAV